jgi:hypothetical protein
VEADMGDYDIFQRFTDGSSLWQLCVTGRYNTQRKLQELAETSGHEFYAVNISSGETISVGVKVTEPISAQKAKAAKANAA